MRGRTGITHRFPWLFTLTATLCAALHRHVASMPYTAETTQRNVSRVPKNARRGVATYAPAAQEKSTPGTQIGPIH